MDQTNKPEQQYSKKDILTKMKELQAEYSNFSSMLKQLTSEEEAKTRQDKQIKALNDVKLKYHFFLKQDGTLTPINWEEVEKLVTASLSSEKGYKIGFNEHGDEGLGYSNDNESFLEIMVESEQDGAKTLERYKRINSLKKGK